MSAPLPAWLISLVDQRLALIDQAITVSPAPLIMTPLKEAPEGATPLQLRQWERTCDCCGKFCRTTEDFYTGSVQRTAKSGALVLMFYGVCQEHAHG